MASEMRAIRSTSDEIVPRTGRSTGAALVGVAFLGSFSFWPALIALGALFDTLNSQLGWSRSQVTTAQLIFTIISVAAAPVIGPLIDRFGARPLLLSGLALLPAALVMIGFVGDSYAHWVAVWIVASLVGQLIAPPVWSSGIARSFTRHRGLALGLAACGFATATAVVPIIIVSFIGLESWRVFYFGMAGFLALVLLPLTFLFYHEKKCAAEGLVVQTDHVAGPAIDGGSFRHEVLHSQRFWQLGAIVFLVSFAVGGMMIHLQPLFRSHGLSAPSAASAYAFYGIGGVVGRLLGGWLLDRFNGGPLPALPMCIFPVLASLAVLAGTGPSVASFAFVALLIGIAAGVEVDVVPYLVRRYFAERFFGRAYISLAAVFVAGAGASPFVVSLIYDGTGSYGPFLFSTLFTGLVATALLVGLGRYPRDSLGR